MARLFDSYIVLTWSAASKPATGEDSIWIGAQTPDARMKLTFRSFNPPTRAKAVEELDDLLARCLKRGDRVLLGVEFPLGLPTGSAEALKLKGDPWRALRDFLKREMKEKPDNSNNRFALAARMNRLMSEGPFPFWGCSKKDELTTLSVKKSRDHSETDIPEYRLVEQAIGASGKPRPQPVWKIAYAGAVGGQMMTGIPAVERLRDKIPALKIWPFEIPLGKLDAAALEDVRVVVAEISPLSHTTPKGASETRNETEVRSLSEWLAERDASGKLAGLFAADASLTLAQKANVEQEEGWILGI